MPTQENHISNYYLLRALARYLSDALVGSRLSELISMSKQELLLQFGEQAVGLRVYLGEESFAFPAEVRNLPRERKYPFPELVNKLLLEVAAHAQDRSFRLVFEDSLTLVFQLYGRNGNAILFKGNNVLRLFRSQFTKDAERKLSDYPVGETVSQEEYTRLVETQGYRKALKALFPSFTSLFLAHLDVADWDRLSTQAQWDAIQQFLPTLEAPQYYLLPPKDIQARPQKPQLLLLQPEVPADEFSGISEALQSYAGRYFLALHFESLHRRLHQKIRHELQAAEANLMSAQRHLEELDTEKNYRAQADILMANLHQIPKGAESVRLHDFYTDKEIEIRLKRELSPQKWAEKLYTKAKNQEIEREKTLEKLLAQEEEISRLQARLRELESIGELKTLKAFAQEAQKAEKQEEVSPYRRFVYEGYEIYVGKKAENNDRLTFGFAHKEDLWLHAKDYTGSHVIIRHKNRAAFPSPVIEKAAELAAWYSKGKTSSLCPVSYTLKKYVRKPKGAPPGAVVHEKEKVVLVAPKAWER